MASAVALDVPHVVYELAPNTRLKLPAPVVGGRITFVIIRARRRSLGASRYTGRTQRPQTFLSALAEVSGHYG